MRAIQLLTQSLQYYVKLESRPRLEIKGVLEDNPDKVSRSAFSL